MTSSKYLDYAFTTIADTIDFATFEFSPLLPGISSENYTPPSELKAGIFYGTSFGNPQTGELNDDLAIG